MPHREWDPKSFFRHLTPSVLFTLLKHPGLGFVLDGKGALWEQAYRAWKAAPADRRLRAEAELGPVNDLSAPHARPYLEDLASVVWPGRSPLRAMPGWTVEDLAVRLFLEDLERFGETHQRYALDLGETVREFQGRYRIAPKATASRKAKLLRALVQCLRAASRGARCAVEDFSDDTKLVIRIFYEGDLHVSDQFTDGGALEPVWRRPAHRLSLVFYFDTSSLLISACRWVEAEKLSAAFAELYAEDSTYFEDVALHPRYCFDGLRDARFRFPTKAEDLVEAVSLVRVEVLHSQPDVRRITIDLEPNLSLEAAHRALADQGIDMSTAVIEGVRLLVRFQGQGRRRIRTVHLTNPNISNLHDTDRDRVIRGYLREWGIDAAFRYTVASSALEATKR